MYSDGWDLEIKKKANLIIRKFAHTISKHHDPQKNKNIYPGQP